MPAQDLLVKLWNLPAKEPVLQRLSQQGVSIKRVIAPDRARVLQFVDNHFGARPRCLLCLPPVMWR